MYNTNPNHHHHVLRNFWAITLMFALMLFCNNAFAQQQQETQNTPTPLPPPVYVPGELPALPLPTQDQINRGRELLEKILFVVSRVSLTDAPAVLKVFGFTDLRTQVYPTHSEVVPKGSDGGTMSDREMQGSGFSSIRLLPLISDPRINVTAWLQARIDTKYACISTDDVLQKIRPVSITMNSSRIIDVHPTARPKPLHGAGRISFSISNNLTKQPEGLGFGFDYQTCASDFGFTNQRFIEEMKK